MPRIKPSESQMKDRMSAAIIKKHMILNQKTDNDIAIQVGFTKRTFQNKCKKPETFTLGELRKICSILRIPAEEKEQIL